MYPRRWLLYAVIGSSQAILPAGSTSIALTPSADTSLLELHPDHNLGAQDDLPAGTLGAAAGSTRSRILLRFDLAGALPASATLEAARLELTVTRVPAGGGANSTFALYRLRSPWFEGVQKGGLPGGNTAAPGESTWRDQSFPLQPWAAPGAAPGLDFETEPSSTERVAGTGLYTFDLGQNELQHLEQWIREPASNLGWILLSQSESVDRSARRFGAREHPLPESRPRLILDFSLPAEPIPPVIKGFTAVDGRATIAFGAQPDVRYSLQGAVDPARGPWELIAGPIQTNAAADLALEDVQATAPHRLYRVAAIR